MRKLLFPAALVVGVSLPFAVALADEKDDKRIAKQVDDILDTYDLDKDGVITWAEWESVEGDWNKANEHARRERDAERKESGPTGKAPKSEEKHPEGGGEAPKKTEHEAGGGEDPAAGGTPEGEKKDGDKDADKKGIRDRVKDAAKGVIDRVRFKRRYRDEDFLADDQNDDLQVTKDELSAGLKAKADDRQSWLTEKDFGVLAKREVENKWPKTIERYDTDKDGSLSREEMSSQLRKDDDKADFDAADANKDSKLTKDEYIAMSAKRLAAKNKLDIERQRKPREKPTATSLPAATATAWGTAAPAPTQDVSPSGERSPTK